ncbi:MAG: septation protein SepH [Candidatus Nanopelagicaceae bacterium]
MSEQQKDLRTVGRSEDGDSLELHDLDGNSYQLRINDYLRSLINQPSPTPLRSVANEPTTEISIKELQARLRAGESMESISENGRVSMEKIERYSHPILQERSYIISLAQKAEIKKLKSTLNEVVEAKLSPRGVEMKNCEWNAYRNEDGTWQILLEYPTRDGKGNATWRFESTKRRIESDDDGARWIMDEEPAPIEAVVRPIRSEEAPPRLISIRSTPTVASIDEYLDDTADLDEKSQVVDEGNLDLDQELSDELELDVEIPSDARRDGVKRKVSIPSWDDIMFGTRKENQGPEK